MFQPLIKPSSGHKIYIIRGCYTYVLRLLLVRRTTTSSCWKLVPYVWFYNLHCIASSNEIYLVTWRRPNQRPKHVVRLNKNHKISCVVTYLISISFSVAFLLLSSLLTVFRKLHRRRMQVNWLKRYQSNFYKMMCERTFVIVCK